MENYTGNAKNNIRSKNAVTVNLDLNLEIPPPTPFQDLFTQEMLQFYRMYRKFWQRQSVTWHILAKHVNNIGFICVRVT